MKRHALHLLLLANAALALVLAWLWFTPTGAVRNVHWQPPTAQKTDFAAMLPVLPSIATADTSQFIAMLDAPLGPNPGLDRLMAVQAPWNTGTA